MKKKSKRAELRNVNWSEVINNFFGHEKGKKRNEAFEIIYFSLYDQAVLYIFGLLAKKKYRSPILVARDLAQDLFTNLLLGKYHQEVPPKDIKELRVLLFSKKAVNLVNNFIETKIRRETSLKEDKEDIEPSFSEDDKPTFNLESTEFLNVLKKYFKEKGNANSPTIISMLIKGYKPQDIARKTGLGTNLQVSKMIYKERKALDNFLRRYYKSDKVLQAYINEESLASIFSRL